MMSTQAIPPDQFLNLWAYLPGRYWVIDRLLNVVAVSQEYLDFVQQSSEAVIHQRVTKLYQPAQHALPQGGLDTLEQTLEEVLQTAREKRLTTQQFASQDQVYELLYRPVLNREQEVEYIIHQAVASSPPKVEIYQTIAMNLPNAAVFVLDHHLRYLVAEGPALQAAGLKSSDLEGQHISEAGSVDITQCESNCRQALAGKPFWNEYQSHGRYFDLYGTPLRNHQGVVYAVMITAYDITVRKEVEEALYQSEEGLHLALDTGGMGKWELDLEQEVMICSDQCKANFGRLPHEPFPYQEWKAAVHPDHRERVQQIVIRSIEERTDYRAEYACVWPDGSTHWVIARGRVREGADEPARNMIGITLDITERKQAEEAMRFREERQRFLLRLSDALQILADPFQIQEAASRILAEHLGTDRSYYGEVDESAGYCVVHRDYIQNDAPSIAGTYRINELPSLFDALRTGQPLVISELTSATYLTPEDRAFLEAIELRACIVIPLVKQGQLVALLAVSQVLPRVWRPDEIRLIEDVAERTWASVELARSERELRKSEERYRTLFESIDEGFCIVEMYFDASGKAIDYQFVEINPAFQGQTGLHNAVGKRMRELAPNHEEHWFETYGRIATTGVPERFTYEAKYLDDRWYDGFAFRVGLPGERRVAILFNDISARKQSEEALRKSEEHLQRILESATDYAIFTLNPEGNITDWNAGASHILGYTKEEAIGQSGSMVFTQEDLENQAVEKELQKARDEGHVANERWHKRKDGGRFWGSGFTVPLRTEDGEVRGFLKIMRDNTERMEMEASLRQAKQIAEEAAQAKEDFLAHMSHEIRTPLNAVVGLSNLLLQQDPQPVQLENLQTLKFSAENLRVLINDILDFSKIRAGKVAMEESDMNLPLLLNSLRRAHQSYALDNGNELHIQVDPQLPEIFRADQLKLSQVLHNLVGNAMKFTQQGSINVEVSLNRREGDTFWVDFSVSDTGIGITADKLDIIFDTFTQADNSTARQYGGTGLGLSITKLLLELMGSRIEVVSEEGAGSRFFFTLMMQRGSAAGVSANEPGQVSMAMEQMGGLKVLLVEDVDINRMVCNQFLENWWQLTADEALNGEEAVNMAQQTQYDLILMDVRMPVMDGYQATKTLRSLPGGRYRHVPILALTADTVAELKKHPEAHLFTDIITKPFDAEDLQQKIIRWVASSVDTASVDTASVDTTRSTYEKQAEGNVPHQSTKKEAAESSSELSLLTISFQKLDEFFQDDARGKQEFLVKASEEFEHLHQKFNQAIAERDETALENLNHRMNLLLDLLSLENLKDSLRHCLVLLAENPTHKPVGGALAQAQAKVNAWIKKVLARLDEQQHQSGPPDSE
ncbi:MAG: PAS domain S-box protein [Cyclobacteriaceae bacterium]